MTIIIIKASRVRSMAVASKESADARLERAVASGSAALVREALAGGATQLDAPFRLALRCSHTSCLLLIIERTVLARTIGSVASVLHRSGLSPWERVRAQALILSHLSESQDPSYEAAIASVLRAGACLREGPLLLGSLVREGHVGAARPSERAGQRFAQPSSNYVSPFAPLRSHLVLLFPSSSAL